MKDPRPYVERAQDLSDAVIGDLSDSMPSLVNLVREMNRIIEARDQEIVTLKARLEQSTRRWWITPEWVTKANACPSEREAFTREFPLGAEITLENIQLIQSRGKDQWFNWILEHLPVEERRAWRAEKDRIDSSGYSHAGANGANCPACKQMHPYILACLLRNAERLGFATQPEGLATDEFEAQVQRYVVLTLEWLRNQGACAEARSYIRDVLGSEMRLDSAGLTQLLDKGSYWTWMVEKFEERAAEQWRDAYDNEVMALRPTHPVEKHRRIEARRRLMPLMLRLLEQQANHLELRTVV